MDTTGEAFAKAVAAELRGERAKKDLLVSDLVERAGISKSAVLHYLNGQRDIPIPAFFALCDALGVSPTVIFKRAEESVDQS